MSVTRPCKQVGNIFVWRAFIYERVRVPLFVDRFSIFGIFVLSSFCYSITIYEFRVMIYSSNYFYFIAN